MAISENPPFGRGEYLDYDANTTAHYLGTVHYFQDVDYSAQGTKSPRSNFLVKCRCVRNMLGAAMLPKRLVHFEVAGTTGLEFLTYVDGYGCITNEKVAVVDEFLPSSGVPDGKLFWVVEEGPAMCLTPLAGADFNGDISVGSVLCALTAVTAGATTAGRVAVQNITASTQTSNYAFLADAVQNRLGRALSARTTGNTNADVLVYTGRVW